MSFYYWSIVLFLRFAVLIRSEYMYQEERLKFRRSIFLLYREELVTLKHESCSCKVKALREEAHSRVKKMLLTLCFSGKTLTNH